MKIKAFTLSEVLLTLAIIGVITAVTIPALTSSNNDKKYMALTKKALVTLQGATDAKIALTSTIPRNDNHFFQWLTDEGGSGDENTLKTIHSADNTAITPDGMVFHAVTDYRPLSDGRFKNTGFIYVDLNGAEGPTETVWQVVNAGEISPNGLAGIYDDTDFNRFDLVRFWVDEQGTFVANDNCEKARYYLKIED